LTENQEGFTDQLRTVITEHQVMKVETDIGGMKTLDSQENAKTLEEKRFKIEDTQVEPDRNRRYKVKKEPMEKLAR
jgi:hypothetical protein